MCATTRLALLMLSVTCSLLTLARLAQSQDVPGPLLSGPLPGGSGLGLSGAQSSGIAVVDLAAVNGSRAAVDIVLGLGRGQLNSAFLKGRLEPRLAVQVCSLLKHRQLTVLDPLCSLYNASERQFTGCVERVHVQSDELALNEWTRALQQYNKHLQAALLTRHDAGIFSFWERFWGVDGLACGPSGVFNRLLLTLTVLVCGVSAGLLLYATLSLSFLLVRLFLPSNGACFCAAVPYALAKSRNLRGLRRFALLVRCLAVASLALAFVFLFVYAAVVMQWDVLYQASVNDDSSGNTGSAWGATLATYVKLFQAAPSTLSYILAYIFLAAVVLFLGGTVCTVASFLPKEALNSALTLGERACIGGTGLLCLAFGVLVFVVSSMDWVHKLLVPIFQSPVITFGAGAAATAHAPGSVWEYLAYWIPDNSQPDTAPVVDDGTYSARVPWPHARDGWLFYHASSIVPGAGTPALTSAMFQGAMLTVLCIAALACATLLASPDALRKNLNAPVVRSVMLILYLNVPFDVVVLVAKALMWVSGASLAGPVSEALGPLGALAMWVGWQAAVLTRVRQLMLAPATATAVTESVTLQGNVPYQAVATGSSKGDAVGDVEAAACVECVCMATPSAADTVPVAERKAVNDTK